jgi:hypothetical protein
MADKPARPISSVTRAVRDFDPDRIERMGSLRG